MNNETSQAWGSRAIRLAATVMLFRAPYEVFLLRRSGRSAFAPDAYVFPGGALDPQDLELGISGRLVIDDAQVQVSGRVSVPASLPTDAPPVSSEERRGLLVAAARELFEEAGVFIGDAMHALDDADREALRSGAFSFAELLDRRDARIAGDRFAFFSHWITPPGEPRRYDTHFYAAHADESHVARADAEETHDGIWIAPNDALDRYERGTMHLVYPTIKHLERLRAFDSVDAALAFARTKPIQTIMPTCPPSEGFQMPRELEERW